MNRRSTPILAALVASSCLPRAAADEAAASDALWTALSSGTPDFSLRWRYEHVDDDLTRNGVPLNDANASTVRATLGYRTGDFHGFGAYLQFEAIGAVGLDDYHDGSGSGNSRFATVVDPEGAEINQGYVSWRPDPRVTLKAGRQIVTYRDAPFHRFMGTVLWRQNWQTHDAFTAEIKPNDVLTVRYSYTWNVNRIFGEDAPDPLSDFESDSHFVNIQYTGIPNLRLEAYAYLIDFDEADRFSSNTFGIRGNGVYPLNETWGVVYTAEYAHQDDASGNPFSVDEDYVLLEGGLKWNIGAFVKSLTVKFSYELLGGDGSTNGAFVTILGTNHAFQGWADRFLVTPNAGIEDYYVTAVMPLGWGLNFVASYHDLNSDARDFDYGDELDVMLTKRFLKRWVIATKASFYDADPGPSNATGGPSADVTKVWVWGRRFVLKRQPRNSRTIRLNFAAFSRNGK